MSKRRLFIALALMSVSMLAIAGGKHDGPPSPPPSSPSDAAVGIGVGVGIAHGGKSNATAHGGNASATGGEGGSASAIGEGGAGGDASAHQQQTAQGGNATASNDGNSQSLSVSSTYEEKRQAPSVFAPAVYASGPCAYGWSAGLSIPGGGISGGRAKSDPGCDRREVARVLTPLNPELALKVLCADPIVAEVATEADCRYRSPPPVEDSPRIATAPVTPPDLSQYATKEELDRAFRQSQGK